MHLVSDRAFLQDFFWTVGKSWSRKRNQMKTKCYSETFMKYLIEHPEATHFYLLTNMKKLEQIGRNGLKKLNFAGWLYFLCGNSLLDRSLAVPCRYSIGNSLNCYRGGPGSILGRSLNYMERVALLRRFPPDVVKSLLVFFYGYSKPTYLLLFIKDYQLRVS